MELKLSDDYRSTDVYFIYETVSKNNRDGFRNAYITKVYDAQIQ